MNILLCYNKQKMFDRDMTCKNQVDTPKSTYRSWIIIVVMFQLPKDYEHSSIPFRQTILQAQSKLLHHYVNL